MARAFKVVGNTNCGDDIEAFKEFQVAGIIYA